MTARTTTANIQCPNCQAWIGQPLGTPVVISKPPVPVTPPVVTPPAPVSASGVNMPKGDLPGWKQVIAEDFDVDVPVGGFVTSGGGLASSHPYAKRIGVYPASWGGLYCPDTVLSTKGSVATIACQVGTNGSYSGVLGASIEPLRPNGSSSTTYGKYEMRMRVDPASIVGTGLGHVLLNIDSNNWPAGGEMDWPEGPIGGPIHGFNHIKGAANGGDRQTPLNAPASVKETDWHTYGREWTPGKLVYLLDGSPIATFTGSDVPDQPLRYLLQTGQDGTPTATSRANLQIDWCVTYDPA